MNKVGVKSHNQERNSFLLPALGVTAALTGACGVVALFSIRDLSKVFQDCQDLNCFKEKISSNETLPIFCAVSPLIAGWSALGLYRSAEKLFSAFQNSIVKSKQSIDSLSFKVTQTSSANQKLLAQVSSLRLENQELQLENQGLKRRKDNTDQLISRIEVLSTEKSTMQSEINKLKALNVRYRNDLKDLKK